MTPARQAWADAMRLADYPDAYLSAVGYASRFALLRSTEKNRTKVAEYRGREKAYAHMAAILLMCARGLSESEAEVRVRRHRKEWDQAVAEDDAWESET